MKMWKKMFGGKKEDKFVEDKKIEMTAEEILKSQDAPRTEPIKGTEEEIGKQAEDGMKKMGFEPAEENKAVEAEKENIPTIRPNGFRPKIRGNDYCPCGSNKKFKKCCVLDQDKINKLSKNIDMQLLSVKATRHQKYMAMQDKKKEEMLKQAKEIQAVAEVKSEA